MAPLAQMLGPSIDLERVEETGSTNADLLERARQRALARPLLRTARRQTQGRGRRGRRWHGADAGALLFSLALPWHRAVADTAAVTLACGLAVAQLLEAECAARGATLRVKWPNDLLLGAGKLAGLLVELAEDGDGGRTLIIGMGLNLATDAAQLARIGAPGAAPAADGGAAILGVAALSDALGPAVIDQADAWLARCALALLEAARRFEREGFAPLQPAFDRLCAYRDTTVQVRDALGACRSGTLRGVDAAGRLQLEVDGRLCALDSGEISLRALAPGVPALATP